jgi:hypothetical protein
MRKRLLTYLFAPVAIVVGVVAVFLDHDFDRR